MLEEKLNEEKVKINEGNSFYSSFNPFRWIRDSLKEHKLAYTLAFGLVAAAITGCRSDDEFTSGDEAGEVGSSSDSEDSTEAETEDSSPNTPEDSDGGTGKDPKGDVFTCLTTMTVEYRAHNNELRQGICPENSECIENLGYCVRSPGVSESMCPVGTNLRLCVPLDSYDIIEDPTHNYQRGPCEESDEPLLQRAYCEADDGVAIGYAGSAPLACEWVTFDLFTGTRDENTVFYLLRGKTTSALEDGFYQWDPIDLTLGTEQRIQFMPDELCNADGCENYVPCTIRDLGEFKLDGIPEVNTPVSFGAPREGNSAIAVLGVEFYKCYCSNMTR